MARIPLPDGDGPEGARALSLARPELAEAIAAYHRAVSRSTLSRRLHELVRMRVAQITGCVVCLNWRNPTWCNDEALVTGVDRADELPGYTNAERVALEYATRFSTDSTGIDEELLARLGHHLSAAEIVELTLAIGKYLVLGRMNQVLGLDQAAASPPTGAVRSSPADASVRSLRHGIESA